MNDDTPSPGEIWDAWVPYKGKPGEGKIRPVLVVSGNEIASAALKVTSTVHSSGHPYWPILLGVVVADGEEPYVVGNIECNELLILPIANFTGPRRGYECDADADTIKNVIITLPKSLADTEWEYLVPQIIKTLREII